MRPTQIAPSAAVYGVILNDRTSLNALGNLDDAPYKGAPRAPVLYIKPATTRVPTGSVVHLPPGAHSVEVSATIGLVMGQDATRRTPTDALQAVSGLVLVADLSLPHSSYYRPAIREKCFDGALPHSDVVPLVDVNVLADTSTVDLVTEIDGKVVQSRSLNDLIRTPANLLAEVSAFMTLRKGDVLLLGVTYRAPEATPGKTGSKVRISCAGFEPLEFSVAAAGEQA